MSGYFSENYSLRRHHGGEEAAVRNLFVSECHVLFVSRSIPNLVGMRVGQSLKKIDIICFFYETNEIETRSQGFLW